MSKTLIDKKVNRVIKKLNKQIKQDVFGNRFEARQLQKSRLNGVTYYMYQLIDNEQPERNTVIPWETGFAITTFHKIEMEMNNFIVNSDFWSKYNK